MPFLVWIIFLEIFHLCHPGVQCWHRINYSASQLCGLQGVSVVLTCRYQFSGVGSYVSGEWYEEKSGRVTTLKCKYPDCSLNIDKLSDDHAGVYHFRFYGTLYRSWMTNNSGVTLSVTDLQVKEEAVAGNQNQTKLTCSTSCSLGSQYVWYKNGQRLQDKTKASIILESTTLSEKGSYSCTVKSYEAYRSSTVCVPAKLCWGVTYSSTSICALLGSSVDIPCTYKYPQDHRIKTASWFKKQKSLNQLNMSSNHVEYSESKENNNCTLRLKEMRESHAGEYGFRFITEQGKTYTEFPRVTITVTTLQVIMTPNQVNEGERVALTCNTSCILTNPTFIWYKNGKPVAKNHKNRDKLDFHSISSEGAGNYSCAVKGHSLSSTALLLNVKYKPKNASVFTSLSETKEGSSVTLTCSSDANPPVHTYTWYMKSGAESLVRGTGESISFNVTSDTSGLYYCEAQNEIGSQKSTEIAVPTRDFPFMITKSGVIITTIILILLTILMLTIFSIYKVARRNIRKGRQQVHSDLSDGAHTAFNFRSKSSEYGNLQAIPPDVSDDTYITVLPEDATPEYENLQGTFQNVRTVRDTSVPLQRAAQDSVYENLQRRDTPQTEMELNDLRHNTMLCQHRPRCLNSLTYC